MKYTKELDTKSMNFLKCFPSFNIYLDQILIIPT